MQARMKDGTLGAIQEFNERELHELLKKEGLTT